MQQLIRYVGKGREDKVCKLNKSIYGLEQSTEQWYMKFQDVILSDGCQMCYEDHCIYIKWSEDRFMILSLYVEDKVIASNNMEFLLEVKK